jgi:anti-sigma factor RsiW
MREVAERCRPFDEDLSAWIDGELAAERRREVDAHLEACPRCAARLDELRGVDRALAGLAAPAVAPDLRARLERRIAAEGKPDRLRPPPRRRRRTSLLAVPAAAAAALALYLVARPGPEPGLAEAELESLDPEALALVIELDTIEDLPVIANLEVLERILASEAG